MTHTTSEESLENAPLLVPDGRRDSIADGIEDFAPGDPENPREWPAAFKWSIVALLALLGFTVTFSCISIAPIANHIVNDLDGGVSSSSEAVLLITIWELGEAAGPLLLAPLSEMLGRRPVFAFANTMFIAALVLTAMAPNVKSFVAGRALTGTAVASNVLNPAVIGDMFPPEQRGTAMTLIVFATIVGGSGGPAMGGIAGEWFGWRTAIWVSAGLATVCALVLGVFFRETYKGRILQRRRAAFEQNKRVPSPIQLRAGGSTSLSTAILRPANVLFGSGVLMALSLYGAVMFSYYYISSITLPTILENVYGLSPSVAGSTFLSNALGSFVGAFVCNLYLDRTYIRLRDRNHGVGLPEHRLPIAIIGALMLPMAVTLYGWCAEMRLPLALLLMSVVWMRLTLVLAFLPLSAYVVDACTLYSASALTGIVVLRCLAGAFLPIVVTVTVQYLGYGWGFTLLSAVTLFLTVIPVQIMFNGSRWRQYSEYTKTD